MIIILFYIFYGADTYLEFSDIRSLKRINKKCYKIKNINFWCTNWQLRTKLNNNILQKYNYIKKLDISYNKNVTDLNYLIHLTMLDISNCPQIKNKHIKNLTDLEELYISDNESTINNDGIKHLTKLTVLDIDENENITDINTLVNLQILHARYTNLDNDGIKNITNLTYLDLSYNNNITDISHMINLETLMVRFSCGLRRDNIKHLEKLTDVDEHCNFDF